jgi:uncharacterized membrane protein HdeD (DUF308 family)
MAASASDSPRELAGGQRYAHAVLTPACTIAARPHPWDLQPSFQKEVAAMTVEVEQIATEEVGRAWYLFAISGVVSFVIGVLVLAYPDPSVKLLGVFLGIDLLIVGGVMIVRGAARDAEPDAGPAAILLGTIALIAGLVVIRNPGKSLVLLAVALGIYLVVAGAVMLGRGLVHRERRWVTLTRAAVLIAAGTVILSWPDISLRALAVLTGIALVLQGAIEIGEAFARSMRSAPER